MYRWLKGGGPQLTQRGLDELFCKWRHQQARGARVWMLDLRSGAYPEGLDWSAWRAWHGAVLVRPADLLGAKKHALQAACMEGVLVGAFADPKEGCYWALSKALVGLAGMEYRRTQAFGMQ